MASKAKVRAKNGQRSQSSSQKTVNEAKAQAKKQTTKQNPEQKKSSSQKTANDSKLRDPGERRHTIGRISARVTMSFAAPFSRL